MSEETPKPATSDLQATLEFCLKVLLALIIAAAWLLFDKLSTEFAMLSLGSIASIHLAGNSKRLKGVGFTAVGAFLAAGLGTGCAGLPRPPVPTQEQVARDAALLRKAARDVCVVLGKQEDPACLAAPWVLRAAESFVKAKLVK